MYGFISLTIVSNNDQNIIVNVRRRRFVCMSIGQTFLSFGCNVVFVHILLCTIRHYYSFQAGIQPPLSKRQIIIVYSYAEIEQKWKMLLLLLLLQQGGQICKIIYSNWMFVYFDWWKTTCKIQYRPCSA